MKKLIYLLTATMLIFSCKKETSKPNTTSISNTNSTDTTKNTTSNVAAITDLECSNVITTGTLKKGQVASNVSTTIPYIGGNGKTFSSNTFSSTGVPGLTATIQAGTLTNGNGTLTYTITGTASISGTASFAIVFGGKNCSINVNVEDVAQTIGKPGTNIIDVEGNSYKTVIIGKQIWMGENLKVSKYSDGTEIQNITDNTQWSKLITGAWCYYNNDATNNSKYGKLYNWYAVANGNKNVCPTGWHVPTDAEWTVLIDYLGGFNVAASKMKEVGTSKWFSPNADATNTSMFTGIPGGTRFDNGYFFFIGRDGLWWSSSEDGTINGHDRVLHYDSGASGKGKQDKRFGMSVRCLKD